MTKFKALRAGRHAAVVIAMLCGSMFASGPGPLAIPAAGATPSTSPPFNECPHIGADTGCRVLIEQFNGGTSFLTDSALGPYDGSDDSLIGFFNNSSATVTSVTLTTNTDAFGFEGDGICASAFTPWPGSTGCPYGPTGYEGPGTSFTAISPDSHNGTVNFAGGIKPGGTAFFSLEENLTASNFRQADTPATGPCTKTYSGFVAQAILVAAGSTTCLTNATAANGATISVPAGASLVVTDSSVQGSILAVSPSAMTFCNSNFGGSITVRQAAKFVLIGDGGDGSTSSPCRGNTIAGAVTLDRDTGGVELGKNHVNGTTIVSGNVAPSAGVPTEDAATEVEGNTMGGSLDCWSNTPPPTNDKVANTVSGARVGQCSSKTF